MSLSNLSILGLYNYDSSIFDDFSVPTGMTKQLAIDTILMECAELELIYPKLDLLKYAIKQWSAKEQANWTKAWTAFNLTYNPIYNKDGTISESITESETENIDRAGTGSATGTADTTDSRTNQVAAYNSESFVNKDKSVGDSETETSTSTTTSEDEDKTRSYSRNSIRTERGNIGVTTTQQMLREEYEIAKVNIYDLIVESFKNRFCLLVY